VRGKPTDRKLATTSLLCDAGPIALAATLRANRYRRRTEHRSMLSFWWIGLLQGCKRRECISDHIVNRYTGL
jgi:hypothetical protein